MTAVLVSVGAWLFVSGTIAILVGRALRNAAQVVTQAPPWVVPDTVDGLFEEMCR